MVSLLPPVLSRYQARRIRQEARRAAGGSQDLAFESADPHWGRRKDVCL